MKIRVMIFVGLWIASLVLISCYGGTVSYGIFFGVTLIPVISWIYILYVYCRFRIFQRLQSRNVVCGQPMPYYFVLQNNDFCTYSGISLKMESAFSYVEDMPDDIEYELLPGGNFRFETRLVCKYRGEYDVGVTEIIVSDFFRLFRLHYKVPSRITALVLPKLVHLEALNSIADVTISLQKEAQTEKTERDILVRDYMVGDALKQIHWKASAREQKLKTRNLIGEDKQGISVFFDTKRYGKSMKEYLPIENKILETLLALGLFFAERNVPLSVYYSQNRMKTSRIEGINSFEAFYTETSAVMFDKHENVETLFEQLMMQGSILKSKMVVCIVHEINGHMITMAEELSSSGIITILYVVTDSNMEDYIRQSGDRMRIVAIPVEAELEGIL